MNTIQRMMMSMEVLQLREPHNISVISLERRSNKTETRPLMKRNISKTINETKLLFSSPSMIKIDPH